jgi:hypothetical protein
MDKEIFVETKDLVFYIGINVPFGYYGDWICGCKWGWHAGFDWQVLQCFMGLIVYSMGTKYLTPLVILKYKTLLIKIKVPTTAFLTILNQQSIDDYRFVLVLSLFGWYSLGWDIYYFCF